MAVKEENIKIIDIKDRFYENMSEAISGLIDVLSFNLNEDDFLYQAGIDNIGGIFESLVKYMKYTKYPQDNEVKIILSEKINKAISGLIDILTVEFNPHDIFFQVGMDNIKVLHRNLIELVKYSNYTLEVKLKLNK